MLRNFTIIIFLTLLFCQCRSLQKEPDSEQSSIEEYQEATLLPPTSEDLQRQCFSQLTSLPGDYEDTLCEHVNSVCLSENNALIFHYDKQGVSPKKTRILGLGVIHGDEPEGGAVMRLWMERLSRIESRNTWRILPIVNPDGLQEKTRTNAQGVDINRNFPTKDWLDKAHNYWKTKGRLHPRRYPGPSPGSERETQCVVEHIKDFKPDLIVALHTPYGVLDFDGPRLKFPRYKHLPWIRLGNFPGSLGRYMWKDRKIPVLTIELKANESLENLEKFDKLQDITGLVSILIDQ